MITEDHKRELDKLFSACLEHDDLLSQWENDFISQFVDKLEKYGEGLKLSDKQQAVLDRIEMKLRQEGAI